MVLCSFRLSVWFVLYLQVSPIEFCTPSGHSRWNLTTIVSVLPLNRLLRFPYFPRSLHPPSSTFKSCQLFPIYILNWLSFVGLYPLSSLVTSTLVENSPLCPFDDRYLSSFHLHLPHSLHACMSPFRTDHFSFLRNPFACRSDFLRMNNSRNMGQFATHSALPRRFIANLEGVSLWFLLELSSQISIIFIGALYSVSVLSSFVGRHHVHKLKGLFQRLESDRINWLLTRIPFNEPGTSQT